MPDEPHRSRLQETIQNFSRVYRGPCFVPHITLGSGVNIPPSPSLSSLFIDCTSVESQDSPFRALYYRCAAAPELLALRSFFSDEEPYIPHISLLYGEHSTARKRDWCQNTPLYTQSISCSTIWIVQGGDNIEKWHPVAIYTLSPKIEPLK